MKRQTMLTALLSSYKDMIDETRVLLEAAAVEKKKRSEDLARAFGLAAEAFLETKGSLKLVQEAEKKCRNRVEAKMEKLHALKEEVIQRGYDKMDYGAVSRDSSDNSGDSGDSIVSAMRDKFRRDRFGSDPNTIPILTGHLQKRSDHLEIWKCRWFELTPVSLNYFCKEKDSVKVGGKPRGTILLRDILQCELVGAGNTAGSTKNMPQTLVVRGTRNNYILAGTSYDIASKWVTQINRAIENLSSDVSSFGGSTIDPKELIDEALEEEFAGALEAANSELQSAISDMLVQVSNREKLTAKLKNISVLLQASEIPMPLLPSSIHSLVHKIVQPQGKGSLGGDPKRRRAADHLKEFGVVPVVYRLDCLGDLLTNALRLLDKNDLSDLKTVAGKVRLCLENLKEADERKKREWVKLEAWVIERADAENRFRHLRQVVDGFHSDESPMKTTILSRNILENFASNDLLSPNRKKDNSLMRQQRRSTGPLFDVPL